MKGFLVLCLGVSFATGCLTFFILFQGDSVRLRNWWQDLARNSETLPFAPYKNRVVSNTEIRTVPANEVIFLDQHLFWKGAGARVVPILNKKKWVEKFSVVDGGKGYSNVVRVDVTGAGGNLFQLGKPQVENGSIISLPIVKAAKWNDQSLVYVFNENQPLSGIVESKYPSGQIIDQTPYLMGQVHGTKRRWNEYGMPVFAKDYVHGKKHGTHIFWFETPNDPDDYTPVKSKNGEIIPTLWIKLREEAKKKFKEDFGTHEANDWVTFRYKTQGGEFPVRLLEHWQRNLRHGLFEGFDQFGNKTFKDDYKMGLRIKHKTFDKTKG
jgi:hypothetical protein